MIVMQRVCRLTSKNHWPVLSAANDGQICVYILGCFSEPYISTSNGLLGTSSLGNPKLFIEMKYIFLEKTSASFPHMIGKYR